MKMNTGYFVVVFLAGFFLGVMSYKTLSQPRFAHGKDAMLEKFNNELHLNGEQKQKVGAILESSWIKMNSVRDEMKPKIQEIKNTANQEIKTILTPKQQTQFDLLQAKWEAEREKNREKWRK